MVAIVLHVQLRPSRHYATIPLPRLDLANSFSLRAVIQRILSNLPPSRLGYVALSRNPRIWNRSCPSREIGPPRLSSISTIVASVSSLPVLRPLGLTSKKRNNIAWQITCSVNDPTAEFSSRGLEEDTLQYLHEEIIRARAEIAHSRRCLQAGVADHTVWLGCLYPDAGSRLRELRASISADNASGVSCFGPASYCCWNAACSY